MTDEGLSVTQLAKVAARAGVSNGVASRVLSGDTTLNVREETRERVRAAARELHYVPHASARALRRRHSGIIGLAVHDLASTMFSELLAGANDAALETGDVILLCDADALIESEAVRQQYVTNQRVGGLLIQGGFSGEERSVEVLAAAVSAVIFNSPGRDGIPGVYMKDRAAGRLAASHLIEMGHRRLGYIGGHRGTYSEDSRRRGVEDALRVEGLSLPERATLIGALNAAQGYEAAMGIGPAARDLTAVVTVNPLVALGALRAFADLGIGVPTDLSVIAIQDSWLPATSVPRISTVALPQFEMGRTAVRLMQSLLRGEVVASVEISTEPSLVPRESTAAPLNPS